MKNEKISAVKLDEISGGEVRYEYNKVAGKWVVLIGNKPSCMFNTEDEAKKFIEGPVMSINSKKKPKDQTWSEWFWSYFGY